MFKSSFTILVVVLSFIVSTSISANEFRIPQDTARIVSSEFRENTGFHVLGDTIHALRYFTPEGSGGLVEYLAYDFDGNPISEPVVLNGVKRPWGSQSRFTVSEDGEIFILDTNFNLSKTGESSIQVFDMDGDLKREFAPWGFGHGKLPVFNDAAICYSNNTQRIYVAGAAGIAPNGQFLDEPDRVYVFDKSGDFLFSFSHAGIVASTLERRVRDLQVRELADGTDEIWIRDHPNSDSWYKVFDQSGQFLRLFNIQGGDYRNRAITEIRVAGDIVMAFLSGTNASSLGVSPADGDRWHTVRTIRTQPQIMTRASNFSRNSDAGIASDGRIATFRRQRPGSGHWDSAIVIAEPLHYQTINPLDRDAVPDVFVRSVRQRPGSTAVDIDFRVDDPDDATVTTAMVVFPFGTTPTLSSIIRPTTFVEGTGNRIGPGVQTGVYHRVSWDAGADWNVDFGEFRVAILARDARTHWFDMHLIHFPEDGDRPAVVAGRHPLRNEDWLTQWFWLVARGTPSILFDNGVITGAGGEFDGVLLASGSTTTNAGRQFLLQRDGLRIATPAELERIFQGATPGFQVSLEPPMRLHTEEPGIRFPETINEYGLDMAGASWPWNGQPGTPEHQRNAWYVVRD